MTLRLFPKISKFPTSVIAAFAMPLITLVIAAAAAGPPPSSCTQELVLFSPCLPYISSPPNNLSGTPSENCCNAFSSSLNSSNNGICLCYLVRESSILGFPVNGTRVLSLPLVCPLPKEDSSNRTGSLESLCSGSPALPPLRSPTSSGHTNPSGSDTNNVTSPLEPGKNSSATPSSPPEFAKATPPARNSAVEPDSSSSATEPLSSSYSWFPSGVLISLVHTSTHLY
ncbi:protein YLS3 [Juglans regia]|uniref:Protein YLS3 n=1 Tax=Juglans regia TaxID=51240 RepID=A0A2I4DYE1_JUGRE|nr:protein YLS3 [Juglans regia]